MNGCSFKQILRQNLRFFPHENAFSERFHLNINKKSVRSFKNGTKVFLQNIFIKQPFVREIGMFFNHWKFSTNNFEFSEKRKSFSKIWSTVF